MKIIKIKYYNDPVLKDLEIDFTNENGSVVDTILIAGENGVGKSYLLNSLFDILNLTVSGEILDQKIDVFIELSSKEMKTITENEHSADYFIDKSDNTIKLSFDFTVESWRQISVTKNTEIGFVSPFNNLQTIMGDLRKVLKCVYSDVEINFNPVDIQNVTSTNIDQVNYQNVKSLPTLATQITQLLIDVQSLDALDFSEWARENLSVNVDASKLDVRMSRFTDAFNFMFPSKKYKKIINDQGQKKIIFEENGREMSIGQLSSGEKQIVFRGGFLLKDKESSRGALVIIDEPELSLHPKWQLNIVNFFKKLFTDNQGALTSQLIITTHSPFILHNSNRSDDKVIVMKKNDKGDTVILQHPEFFNWSSETLIEKAFDISHIISANKFTIFVEGETDEKYFNECIKIFQKQLNVEFKWIGRINESGNVENTGDTALNQARTFFIANMQQTNKTKLMLLYDSDTNKPEETHENLYIRKMEVNNENLLFRIGVENLLLLPDGFNASEFYKEKKKKDYYGAESIIRELDKSKLCRYICSDLNVEDKKNFLKFVNLEFDRVATILNS